MNTELFIARRLYSDKDLKSGFSRPIISIAIIGIVLGMAVMIISVAVVTGFKLEIRNKIAGFNAHIQIVNYDNNSSYETSPINKNQEFLAALKETPGINHIQQYALIPGIIKTSSDIEGVVLKGIGNDFKWDFFKTNTIEGNIFSVNDSVKINKVLISKHLASLLKLKVGDDLRMYFAQNPPRVRKFNISGIYETSLVDFDKIYVIGDIGHVQKLKNWNNNQISGFEIEINNFKNIDYMSGVVADIVGYNYNENEDFLMITNIKEKHVQIFDWLNLQDMNVWVILILMLIVAGFNMVSGLLILILERTNMIGILKALGATNINIRKIFLYQSGFLISKGLLWGNIIGIIICLIQYYFQPLKLDQASYFLNTVPINFNLLYFIMLNIGTLFLTLMMLLIPSHIIAKISPDKSIRFE